MIARRRRNCIDDDVGGKIRATDEIGNARQVRGRRRFGRKRRKFAG